MLAMRVHLLLSTISLQTIRLKLERLHSQILEKILSQLLSVGKNWQRTLL